MYRWRKKKKSRKRKESIEEKKKKISALQMTIVSRARLFFAHDIITYFNDIVLKRSLFLHLRP